MLLNRLVQVVLLSAYCSLTIPTWASTNTAEGGATKKVPASPNHLPGVDRHKKYSTKSFPGQDWKAPAKKNHAMPALDAKKEGKIDKLQQDKPDYPEPEFKPKFHPTTEPNYPEPQI